jgi:bacterioferritin-associated ferredoxin
MKKITKLTEMTHGHGLIEFDDNSRTILNRGDWESLKVGDVYPPVADVPEHTPATPEQVRADEASLEVDGQSPINPLTDQEVHEAIAEQVEDLGGEDGVIVAPEGATDEQVQQAVEAVTAEIAEGNEN